MTKSFKKNQILAPETFFYTIPLEKPNLRLTRKELDEHYPAKHKKMYMGNQYDYINYANGILTVEVVLSDTTKNRLYIHVEPDELQVACSCGMPGEKLCRHAYLGLYHMAWHDYYDFESYYWPDYDSDEKKHQKFFYIQIDKRRIIVEPKGRYGNIYRPNIGFLDNHHPHVSNHLSITKQMVGTEGATVGGVEVIAFCVCYTFGGYYHAHLPVIMPCLAKTSKDGKKINSILQFNTDRKPITKVGFTSNQELLKNISLKQYEIAKNWDKLSETEKGRGMDNVKEELYALWREAFPLLVREKYCCANYTWWLKYLNDKPRKKYLRDCRFSEDKPVLSFVLKFCSDYFLLIAEVRIKDELLKTHDWSKKPPIVLFDDKNEICYLMQSTQDDDLFWWMLTTCNRLTILKEHFIDFHQRYLEQLSNCYSTIYINRFGKRQKYSFDDVFKETLDQNSK